MYLLVHRLIDLQFNASVEIKSLGQFIVRTEKFDLTLQVMFLKKEKKVCQSSIRQ